MFTLTTLDAGTRVGRFLLQDALSHLGRPFGRTSWFPSTIVSSALVVAAWGYFLHVGIIDPYCGINILLPLFGIANLMLAGIALAVVTAILLKGSRARHAWITALPLAWLAIVTTTAAWEKLFSANPKIGCFAGAADLAMKLAAGTLSLEKAAVASKLIFKPRLDAALTAFFLFVLSAVILDMLRIVWRRARGAAVTHSPEAAYQRTRLVEGAGA